METRRLHLIPEGSLCHECRKQADYWHPHVGLCCKIHLDLVLDGAVILNDMRFLIKPTSDAFISISGGVDSIAAAFILKKKFNLNHAYHFNHGTEQANEMESAVRAFCKDFNFKLIVRYGEGLKGEDSFRQARLGAFFETGGDLVTAHHLSDAIESFCMNFLRGHEDYLPIPIQSNFPTGRVLHPFLLTEKDEFKRIAVANKLEKYIVEDKSNSVEAGIRRNWVRNSLIPMIEGQKIGLKKIVRKKYLAFIWG